MIKACASTAGASDKTLLLVDDDPVFLEVLAKALRKRGFDVREAGNIDRANEILSEVALKFAIIDLRIGADSGLTLLRNLRGACPDVHAVVLTGYGSIATAVEAVKAGAQQYLTKPAAIEHIINALLNREPGIDTEVMPEPPSLRRLEWEHIQKVLSEHDGNISATARALGMHRRTLQRKLQKHPVKR
jgi:two-component system response regulator RegA